MVRTVILETLVNTLFDRFLMSCWNPGHVCMLVVSFPSQINHWPLYLTKQQETSGWDKLAQNDHDFDSMQQKEIPAIKPKNQSSRSWMHETNKIPPHIRTISGCMPLKMKKIRLAKWCFNNGIPRNLHYRMWLDSWLAWKIIQHEYYSKERILHNIYQEEYHETSETWGLIWQTHPHNRDLEARNPHLPKKWHTISRNWLVDIMMVIPNLKLRGSLNKTNSPRVETYFFSRICVERILEESTHDPGPATWCVKLLRSSENTAIMYARTKQSTAALSGRRAQHRVEREWLCSSQRRSHLKSST